ncbi:hypothetical protein ACTMTJ_39285 [Phytohabitans sp. LJ34]|uniref:hypothetical protein n=1 Tax=Phytohabitans sp. LJ34 TaxID=3452217 RepID=UPI003F8BF386
MSSEIPTVSAARDVGPGGTIRFAIGTLTGLRSSTWRIWTPKHTTDVYLAPRGIAGVQKISLHASGNWSYSFVSDTKAAPFVPEGASRHIDLWEQAPPFDAGWRRGYSIIVPWTDLRRWPEVERGDVVFAPHPGDGYWVYVEIVFVAAGTQTRLVLDEMYALGNMRLVDGGEVKIIARRVRPSWEEAGRLAAAREQALQDAWAKVGPTLYSASMPRITIHGNQSDGTRFSADLAVRPLPPGQMVICTRELEISRMVP